MPRIKATTIVRGVDVPIGTSNTFPTPQEYVFADDEVLLQMSLDVSGVAVGETITIRIIFVYEDGTSNSVDVTITSDGFYTATEYLMTTNLNVTSPLASIQFTAASDQTTTAVTIRAYLRVLIV